MRAREKAYLRVSHVKCVRLDKPEMDISREKGILTKNSFKNVFHTLNMGHVKRICVFEHSVMKNFNCACPAIQRGQGFGYLSEGSS